MAKALSTHRECAAICRALASMQGAGLGPRQMALALEHAGDPADHIELLKGLIGSVPASHLAVIEAGASSGNLEQAFTELALDYEHAAREHDERRRALRPATLLLGAAAVLLPLPTVVRDGVSGYLLHALPAIAAAVCARAALEYWLFPRVLREPLGRARMLRSLALMLSAGAGPALALRTAGSAAGDADVAARAATAARAIERGGGLAAALRGQGLLSGATLAWVAQGETTGRMPEALRRAAGIEEDEARRASSHLVRVVGGLFWAVGVALVAWNLLTAIPLAMSLPSE